MERDDIRNNNSNYHHAPNQLLPRIQRIIHPDSGRDEAKKTINEKKKKRYKLSSLIFYYYLKLN